MRGAALLPRTWSGRALGLAAAAVLATTALSPAPPRPTPASGPSLRITSPLGRTGAPGTVRIVAQIHPFPGTQPGPVRFYVDGALVGTDTDGPPYAVDWDDDNPYAARRITVRATDGPGRVLQDSIALAPLEVTEESTVTRVLVEASVLNRQGHFVGGLGPSNFRLTENGVPQKLELVQQEAVPVTFALLVDSSHSMSRRIAFVRQAAAQLAARLRPRDRALVVPFARHLGHMTGPTDDRATIAGAIGDISARGGTAIFDALVAVSRHLRHVRGRRTIVLITDGYDENSTAGFDQALRAVKAVQATVYVVAIGGIAGVSFKGEDLLRRLARETGGRIFFPDQDEELVGVSDRLMTDAQRRYILTYSPTNDRRDGRWRRITVTTTPVAYRVVARAGYYAPAPSPVRALIEFTATGPDGQPTDVTAGDLLVREDGVPQKIQSFEEAVAPVSIVLALDASGSMRASAADVVQAARTFIEALRPEDSLAIVTFANRVVMAHDFTLDRRESLQTVAEYQTGGGTPLYDALMTSLNRLRSVHTRRAVVVLTDGRDENNPGTAPGSVATLSDVLEAVKTSGAAVFTIGLGTRVDRQVLGTIAERSGGQAYFPSDVSLLPRDYHRVLEALRRRFAISYTSTNAAHDGRWRHVDIRVRGRDVHIDSQGGYFAPAH